MTVVKRGNSYQVSIKHRGQLYRYQAGWTEAEAWLKHAEVERCLMKYGKYPVKAEDHPIVLKPNFRKHEKRKKLHPKAYTYLHRNPAEQGSLARAARYTEENQWKGRYDGSGWLAQIVDYMMREKGYRSLDEIDDTDIQAFVKWREAQGVTASSSLNKSISAFKIMWHHAMEEHHPPLVKRNLKFRRVKKPSPLTWGMGVKQMASLLTHLRSTKFDELHELADFIEFVCYTGLRTEEALRVDKRHFRMSSGDNPTPMLKVQGTKTRAARRDVPLVIKGDDTALKIFNSRASSHRMMWGFNYTRLHYLWANHCRTFLDVQDIPTSTLICLRRTFAKIMNDKGVPTATIRKWMGHTSILTTQKYIDLLGDDDDLERMAS